MPNGNGYLTFDEILAVKDIDQGEFDVPEWGGKVLVRGLNAGERNAILGELFGVKQKLSGSESETNIDVHVHRIQVRVCSMGLIDLHGNRLCEPHRIEKLAAKSPAAIERIFQAIAQRTPGLGVNPDKQTEEAQEKTLGESEAAAQPAVS